MDRTYDWNRDKNKELIKTRGISFEAIVSHIESGNVIAIVNGQGKFKHQKQFMVLVDRYVYVVPFIETGEAVFLKTIIPSRKMTKYYLSGGKSE